MRVKPARPSTLRAEIISKFPGHGHSAIKPDRFSIAFKNEDCFYRARDARREPAQIWPRHHDRSSGIDIKTLLWQGDGAIRSAMLRSNGATIQEPNATIDWMKRLAQEAQDSRRWELKVQYLRSSIKDLVFIQRVLARRQIFDAIESCATVQKEKYRPIHEELQGFCETVAADDGDLARVYIETISASQGPAFHYNKFVSSSRPKWDRTRRIRHKDHNATLRRHNNYLTFRMRELSLNEYFHQVCILKKGPQSLSFDMLLSINEGRADPMSLTHWAPYLTPLARTLAQMEMKRLDDLLLFDYHAKRREFLSSYVGNLLRMDDQRRTQRGLFPRKSGNLIEENKWF